MLPSPSDLRGLAAPNRLDKRTKNMKHQMIRPGVKALLAAALVLLVCTGEGSSATGRRQVCNGILTHDNGGYMLKPDPDSKSLWCDAYIGEGDGSSLAQRVLKTCVIGSRCHIEGLFRGHGVFYWTQISSVSLLSR